MDIDSLLRKYNIFEGLSWNRKKDRQLLEKMNSFEKRVYNFFYTSLWIGIFGFCIGIVLKHPYTYQISILYIVVIGILKQKWRIKLKKKYNMK